MCSEHRSFPQVRGLPESVCEREREGKRKSSPAQWNEAEKQHIKNHQTKGLLGLSELLCAPLRPFSPLSFLFFFAIFLCTETNRINNSSAPPSLTCLLSPLVTSVHDRATIFVQASHRKKKNDTELQSEAQTSCCVCGNTVIWQIRGTVCQSKGLHEFPAHVSGVQFSLHY